MSTHAIAVRIAGLVGVFAIFVAAPAPPVRACGGFFCNAVSQTPIIQAGERVLFAKHDGLVTMHIEIVYQGEPTEFGWILPVPDAPKDARGEPLPLEKAVAISSPALFPMLQSQTDPVFRVDYTYAVSASCAFNSTATGGFADATTATGGGGDSGSSGPPPVVVLEEAKVGPYNAQLIEATRSDALFAWLNDNGYLQDANAQPMLDHYVQLGYKFVGIRLQSGKSTGDLKPLALTLGEDAPCVPLRLTAIAATPGMPILVWVLGDARAVPKNFIHARLNDLAFQFPGGGNYQQLVSDAIDQSSGRAWVTEFAGSVVPFRGALRLSSLNEPALRAATTLEAVLFALRYVRSAAVDVEDAIRAEVHMPAGLKGYPYGNCFYCDDCGIDFGYDAGDCSEPNADHDTTEAEFYGYLEYFVAQGQAEGDPAALRARIEAEVIEPRAAIEALFEATTTITRFFTTLDPAEMTKDPIFAFNPDLPDVSNDHVVTTTVRSNAACDTWVDAVYADGTRWRVSCYGSACFAPTIGPVPGQSPLLWPEVLDESGDPMPFSPSQSDEVDALLTDAMPGFPSLPPTFEAESPPKPPKPVDTAPIGESSGCSTGGLAAPGAIALAAAMLLARRRREIVRGA